MRRRSTLHSAHRPVRGHSAADGETPALAMGAAALAAGVVDAPVGALVSVTEAPGAAVEEAVPASWEAPLVHAAAAAQISRNRQGNFVIDL